MFAAKIFGINIPNTTVCRHWRIIGNGGSFSTSMGGYLAGIHAISFYESSDASGPDVNIGATATSSSVYDETGGYVASKANDNNVGTYWASSPFVSTNHWWACQYASGKNIKSVSIIAFYVLPAYISTSYKLQYSVDGNTWFDKSTFSTANVTSIQTFTNL